MALIAVVPSLRSTASNVFFTLLSEQEVAGGLDDIFVFEKKVGSTFIPSPETGSQPDKLELLTMHKSKGLEFDHVLLPGLSQSTKHDDKDLYGMERLNAEGNPEVFSCCGYRNRFGKIQPVQINQV